MWNWVPSRATPRMTAGKSPSRQRSTTECSMQLDRFCGIARASWLKSAVPSDQRAQRQLVETNDGEHQDGQWRSSITHAESLFARVAF